MPMAADSVLDASHEKTATATTMTVCSAEPTSQADISNVALASTSLTPGLGNGDFSVANGGTGGRKVSVAAQDDINIDSTGEANYIALDDGAELLRTTQVSTQELTSGGSVSVAAHDYEIDAPALV